MDEDELKEYIIKVVGYSNYRQGFKYKENSVKLTEKKLYKNNLYFTFEVLGDSYWDRSQVIIVKHFDEEVLTFNCRCMECYRHGNCGHIASALIRYGNRIISTKKDDVVKEVTKSIFKQMSVDNDYRFVTKKELKLEVEVDFDNSVNIKIGLNRLYVIKTKLNDFFNCYYTNKGMVEFGKSFVYDPKIHYFNEEDSKIIDFIYDYLASKSSCFSSSMLRVTDNSFKQFLKLIKKKGFYIKNIGYISTIYEEFPFASTISKDSNNYILNLDIEENSNRLTSDCEYIVTNNKCYHLKKEYASVLSNILSSNLNKLIFTKRELETFSKCLLPIIKEKIVIDSTADDIVIVKKPDCKLYFDLNYNDVICNVKLIYGFEEIDYFDKKSNILRDIDYEKDILNELVYVGFILKDNRIVLDDIDTIGDFLENKLKYLADKYETYTSQKIKNITVVKNSNVTSTFSIGKDNIMKFSFDLGDISNLELDNIFSSLRKNKKYYKLKNGNFLNLEDNSDLRQLEDLSRELELTNKELISGSGIIPKYRAIYLDSLKDRKYDIIRTDGLFNKFIDNFKSYKEMSIDFTKEELSVLRDYQKTGIKWLYNIYKCDFGGILADEMGLGKSLQMLYFIRRIIAEDKNNKILIVVPTSLVYNWENEIKKFTPEVDYQVLSGFKEQRHELLKKSNSNIYITSYGMLREDFDYYKDIKFKICVIDEAQNIKNPNAGITKVVKQVKAETRFALTGTPIENSIIELWSIFDYIMPGFLAGITSFQSKYHVKEYDDDTNKRLSLLNTQISPFILRRKKKEVLTELPDKIENNIFVDLSDSQKKLYAKEVEKVKKELEEITTNEGWTKARFLFLQLITKLRQLCIDPRIVYENYTDESTKIENLIKVVKEVTSNGHKVLIFTSFKTALNIAKTELSNNDISSYVIDGSVSSQKRMELVEKFNTDDTSVFLIMLKAGGTGLNLTSADIVIHLDIWWNPQAENQATDRAHRIGQKNKVEVIKLIASGTIEERILELQEKKKILSDKLIEGDNRDQNILSRLSAEDVKYLLSYEQNEEEK